MTARASWLVSRSRGQLRIAYGAGPARPQYAALHLHDSYLRLNYGPGAGWGTSVILLPIYWCGGICHHGARVQADWAVVDADLAVRLTGSIGCLDVLLRVTLSPPQNELIMARVEAQCGGCPALDARPGEAFKPVMLSSMRIGETRWDAQSAHLDGKRMAIPPQGWIYRDPQRLVRTFGLLGGSSLWKRNAPSVQVELEEPLPVSGWVTRSENPNDDNVGLWAASDRVLTRWSYRVIATPSDEDTARIRPKEAFRPKGRAPRRVEVPPRG